MIKSEVKFSEVENRFDADYYKPEYLDMMKVLNKFSRIKNLGILLNKMKYGLYLEANYKDQGIPFLRSMNLGEYAISGEILRIAKKLEPEVKNYRLKEGDILIARTGTAATVGNTGIVTEEFENATFGSYTILLRIKEKELLPQFLLMFLKCKFGKSQLERLARGIRQKNINEPLIRSVKVPIPSKSFQEKIEKTVKDAYNKRKEANKLLEKAENKLLEILGIDFGFKEEQNYKASFSDFDESTRLDAEYYKPKYTNLLERIKESKFEIKSLGEAKEFLKISNEKIDPTKNPAEHFKYITIKSVDPSSGIIIEHEDVVGHKAPSRARMVIKKNDVLVPYLSGSSDAVTMIPEKYDGGVASTGFYILRPMEAIPEFLFLLMRSKLVQLQIEQKTSGAVMTSINKTDFEEIKIPILPEKIQEKVAAMVGKSFELRKESRQLVEKAKKEVGSLIEGGKNE